MCVCVCIHIYRPQVNEYQPSFMTAGPGMGNQMGGNMQAMDPQTQMYINFMTANRMMQMGGGMPGAQNPYMMQGGGSMPMGNYPQYPNRPPYNPNP